MNRPQIPSLFQCGIRACVYLKEVGGGTDLREKLLEKQNPNCKESLVYCKESLVSSKKQS